MKKIDQVLKSVLNSLNASTAPDAFADNLRELFEDKRYPELTPTGITLKGLKQPVLAFNNDGKFAGEK